MSEEQIELTVSKDQYGRWIVVDQHGRSLRGQIGVSIDAQFESCVELNVRCHQYEDGRVIAMLRKS